MKNIYNFVCCNKILYFGILFIPLLYRVNENKKVGVIMLKRIKSKIVPKINLYIRKKGF